MSKIMQTIKWFREVSVLAEDEQRRSGHPEIDVEHLFLTLTSIGGPVTDALARQGVTLATARAAFERIHANRVAQFGISLPVDYPPRTIPEGNARGSFVYREGVRAILEEAANHPGPDAALFEALTKLWTAPRTRATDRCPGAACHTLAIRQARRGSAASLRRSR